MVKTATYEAATKKLQEATGKKKQNQIPIQQTTQNNRQTPTIPPKTNQEPNQHPIPSKKQNATDQGKLQKRTPNNGMQGLWPTTRNSKPHTKLMQGDTHN